jgi:hypothetical protein
MHTISYHRQPKSNLNGKYKEYLAQWGKPKSRFLNKYNLFYDFNYWDRYWLRKTRRYVKKIAAKSMARLQQ